MPRYLRVPGNSRRTEPFTFLSMLVMVTGDITVGPAVPWQRTSRYRRQANGQAVDIVHHIPQLRVLAKVFTKFFEQRDAIAVCVLGETVQAC